MTPTPAARLGARQMQVLRILNTPAGIHIAPSPILDAVAYAERRRRQR